MRPTLTVSYWPDNTFTLETTKWPTMREAQALIIRATLCETRGNKTKAAELLGMSRQTLRVILNETSPG